MCPTRARRCSTLIAAVGHTWWSFGIVAVPGAAQTFATVTATVAIARPTGLVLVALVRARAELVDHGRVGERRRVPERAVLGHVAQQAPHDLAAAGLGQLGREDDVR